MITLYVPRDSASRSVGADEGAGRRAEIGILTRSRQ